MDSIKVVKIIVNRTINKKSTYRNPVAEEKFKCLYLKLFSDNERIT